METQPEQNSFWPTCEFMNLLSWQRAAKCCSCKGLKICDGEKQRERLANLLISGKTVARCATFFFLVKERTDVAAGSVRSVARLGRKMGRASPSSWGQ